MNESNRIIQWLLSIIVVILVLVAIKLARPVIMPFAFAVFIIILTWPVHARLGRQLPNWLAFILTLFLLVLVFAAFVFAFIYCFGIISENLPLYSEKLNAIYIDIFSWLASQGMPVSIGEINNGSLASLVFEFIEKPFDKILSFFALSFVMAAFLVFGLLEVISFRKKLARHLGDNLSLKLIVPTRIIAAKFQRYILTRTFTSMLAAVFTGLLTWVLGMDLVVVWAVLSFLLGFVPVLGSIVLISLLTLFSLIQFNGLTIPLFAFLGATGIQVALGNYIDPMLQAKFLSISPLVVLFSIVFWGWFWGIPGALIGVPLTAGILIACDQFERTRWVTVLLADIDDEPETGAE